MAKYVISLTTESRRNPNTPGIVSGLSRFSEVNILKKGWGERNVTVEMPESLVSVVRDALPYAHVEPCVDLQLL